MQENYSRRGSLTEKMGLSGSLREILQAECMRRAGDTSGQSDRQAQRPDKSKTGRLQEDTVTVQWLI